MPKIEWTKEDEQAAREANAIKGSFKSTRGKAFNGQENKEPLRKAA